MEKKKNKKSKKSRLSLLGLLMFLSIVLLSTSTYAWFTANRTVTINDIDVQVETSGGLQISTDGVNWKTSLSNLDITTNAYTGNTNQFPSILTATSSALQVVEGGKMEMYTSTIGTREDGEFTLSTAKATDAAGTTGSYIAFDVFVKNESSGGTDNGEVYLTKASDVVAKTGSDDLGLKNAARVAFVIGQTSTNLTAPAATYIALNAPESTDGTNVVLWEPNYDVHTATGAASATYYFNQTVAPAENGAAALTYLGVKTEINAIPLRWSLQSADERSNNFTAIDTGNYPNATFIKTPAANVDNGTTQLLMTKKGITKVRIYMCIEGQDVDCENNVTGTDITYKITLSKNAD